MVRLTLDAIPLAAPKIDDMGDRGDREELDERDESGESGENGEAGDAGERGEDASDSVESVVFIGAKRWSYIYPSWSGIDLSSQKRGKGGNGEQGEESKTYPVDLFSP